MVSQSQLRKDIRRSGASLAEISRRAGVALTTLHSFMSRDGSEMRASNFTKVADAFVSLMTEAPRDRARGLREDSAAFESAARMTVEIPVTEALMKTLRDGGHDVEAIARAGAEKALKEAEAKAWAEANREAIDAYNKWIAKHGTLAEQLGLI
jgi:antitoxin CcdA